MNVSALSIQLQQLRDTLATINGTINQKVNDNEVQSKKNDGNIKMQSDSEAQFSPPSSPPAPAFSPPSSPPSPSLSPSSSPDFEFDYVPTPINKATPEKSSEEHESEEELDESDDDDEDENDEDLILKIVKSQPLALKAERLKKEKEEKTKESEVIRSVIHFM